jgi:hypothetical protein
MIKISEERIEYLERKLFSFGNLYLNLEDAIFSLEKNANSIHHLKKDIKIFKKAFQSKDIHLN